MVPIICILGAPGAVQCNEIPQTMEEENNVIKPGNGVIMCFAILIQ